MSWLRRGTSEPGAEGRGSEAGPAARPSGAGEAAPAVLRVDWPAYQGRGVCAEVLPELVTLDEWGYPIIRGEVDVNLLALSRQAAADCPHHALRLVR